MMDTNPENFRRIAIAAILVIVVSGCGLTTNYDDAMRFLEVNGYEIVMTDPKPVLHRRGGSEDFWFRAMKDGKQVEGYIQEARDAKGRLVWHIHIQ